MGIVIVLRSVCVRGGEGVMGAPCSSCDREKPPGTPRGPHPFTQAEDDIFYCHYMSHINLFRSIRLILKGEDDEKNCHKIRESDGRRATTGVL